MKYRIGDKIEGRYEIETQVGKGGTATVFRARDLSNNETVALKIGFDKTSSVTNTAKRFIQEGDLLLKIDNVNVVKVKDMMQADGHNIIVMEYIDGTTLDTFLKRRNIVKPDQAVDFLLQLINALGSIHNEGIMHRDIKPSNIMLDVDGTLKLMDFGIAQVSEDQNLTKEGNIIGSLPYMAPELITRTKKASPTSEIYSMGVMLYYMTTGVLPFKPVSDQNQLAKNIIAGDYKDARLMNRSIDPILDTIINKMMMNDYLERFSDIEDLKIFLEKYLNGDLAKELGTKKTKSKLFKFKRD